MFSLISLTALFSGGSNTAVSLAFWWFFAAYAPISYAPPIHVVTADQIERARQTVQTHPDCAAVFIPVAHSPLTLMDFGIFPQSSDSPVHLINLWALWCAPCRHELPLLNRLSSETSANIHTLNLDDEPVRITTFAEQNDLQYLDLSISAPENILSIVGAQGLPYNALFYGEQLIGKRNQAIHDPQQLHGCLDAISSAE